MSKKHEVQQLKQAIELSNEFAESKVQSETEAAYQERRQKDREIKRQMDEIRADARWKEVRLVEVFAVYQLKTGEKVSLKSVGLDKAILAIAKNAGITESEVKARNEERVLAKARKRIARMEAMLDEQVRLLEYNRQAKASKVTYAFAVEFIKKFGYVPTPKHVIPLSITR